MFEELMGWGATNGGHANVAVDDEITQLEPEELVVAFLAQIEGTEEALAEEVAEESGLDFDAAQSIEITKQVAVSLIRAEKVIGGRHNENGQIYLRPANGVNLALEVLEALLEIGGGDLPEIGGLM